MRREAGMTLVEVMISAVVLSLLMLALAASLRAFATTYTAVEQSADRTARLREVTYFLRHVLREAYSPHRGALHISDSEISWLAPIDRTRVCVCPLFSLVEPLGRNGRPGTSPEPAVNLVRGVVP